MHLTIRPILCEHFLPSVMWLMLQYFPNFCHEEKTPLACKCSRNSVSFSAVIGSDIFAPVKRGKKNLWVYVCECAWVWVWVQVSVCECGFLCARDCVSVCGCRRVSVKVRWKCVCRKTVCVYVWEGVCVSALVHVGVYVWVSVRVKENEYVRFRVYVLVYTWARKRAHWFQSWACTGYYSVRGVFA